MPRLMITQEVAQAFGKVVGDQKGLPGRDSMVGVVDPKEWEV